MGESVVVVGLLVIFVGELVIAVGFIVGESLGRQLESSGMPDS